MLQLFASRGIQMSKALFCAQCLDMNDLPPSTNVMAMAVDRSGPFALRFKLFMSLKQVN
jgi:hypothetical protein